MVNVNGPWEAAWRDRCGRVLSVTPRTLHVASFDALEATTAYRLWKLRVDVFVVEQECPYPELDGRDLEPDTRHVWIAEEGAPVAYLRLIRDEGEARIGRVCVARKSRGAGLAAELMRAALDEIGDNPSVLDAQAYLSGWYARFGYEVTGEEFLDDGIPHVPMRRTP
jgi:ElaA protein